MRQFANVAALQAEVGNEVAVSEWMVISQERVNQFATATDDPQWIHVDVERAKRESPFGGTIAHGYMTLSLIPALFESVVELPAVVANVALDALVALVAIVANAANEDDNE